MKKKLTLIIIFIALIVICFSTCVANQNTNEKTDKTENSEASISSIAEDVTVTSTTTSKTTTKEVSTTTSKSVTESKTETKQTTTKKVTKQTTTKKTTKPKETTKTTTITTTKTEPVTTTASTTVTTSPNTKTDKRIKYPLENVTPEYKHSATALACIQSIFSYYGVSTSQSDLVKYLNVISDYPLKDGLPLIDATDTYYIGNPNDENAIGSSIIPIYFMLENYIKANNLNFNYEPISYSSEDLIEKLNQGYIPIVFICDTSEYKYFYVKKGNSSIETVSRLPKEMYSAVVIGMDKDSFILYIPSQSDYIVIKEKELRKVVGSYVILIKH